MEGPEKSVEAYNVLQSFRRPYKDVAMPARNWAELERVTLTCRLLSLLPMPLRGVVGVECNLRFGGTRTR